MIKYKENIKCPRCNLFLKQVQTKQGFEIDVCEQCWGIWLDGDEYDYAECEVGLPEPERVMESEFSCPRCGGVVQEFWYETPKGKLLIDQCKNCEGVWLDNKKELTELKNLSREEHRMLQEELEAPSFFDKGQSVQQDLMKAYTKLAVLESTREERKEYLKHRANSRRRRRGFFAPRISETARRHQAEIDGTEYHRYGWDFLERNPIVTIVIFVILFVIALIFRRC